MANTPTQTDIESVVEVLKERLVSQPQTTSATHIGMFVGGFPGSGKTTVAHELATEKNLVHVQANDVRVLLAEKGLKWGEADNPGVYVRQVLKPTLQHLCYNGHSFVVDGGFIEHEAEELRQSLKRKFNLKMLLVAVDCPLHVAKSRAIARYADGKPSTFGDWRAKDFNDYVSSMLERKKKLHDQLHLNPNIRTMINIGTIPELKQWVQQVLRDFA